jgi:hypothetical protein
MSAREILTYSEYLGYSTVSDETNSNPRFLQRPSKNVYVDWNSAVKQRKGILLCGDEGSVENGGVKGVYTFVTPRGVFHSLRVIAEEDRDVLQRLVKTVDGSSVTWGWDSVGSFSNFTGTNDFVTFTEVNDENTIKTYLVIGTGNQYINVWDGGYARVASEDIGGADTITIDGDQSLVDLGFTLPSGGTESLIFVGDNPGSFTYTGFSPSDNSTESVGVVTFNTSTDVVTHNNHKLGTNTPIKFTTTGSLPTGITADQMYFAVSVTTNTFKVAATPNGTPIDLSNSPSGTNTVHRFIGVLDTFAGVTITSGTISDGDRIYTSTFSTSNTTLSLPADYTIDFVGAYRNQLYLGSRKSRTIKISHATSAGSVNFSFVNFTTSLDVGGPRTILIDDTCGGFEPTKDGMIIFGSTNSVFKRAVIISSDQTKEFSEITRMETAPRQGLGAPLSKLNIKNALVYVTKEKTLDTLSFIENISELQATPISDVIKSDFEEADFTNASVYYFERNLFVIAPASAKIFWYDLERKLWQAPINFTQEVMGLMSVTEDGNLLVHSAQKDSSFFMFQGDNDNGAAIDSNATFSYNHFGERYRIKVMGVCVQDGYITPNGVLSRVIEYGYRGDDGSYTFVFSGGNTDFLYHEQDDGGLGKAPLGQRTLGGSSLVKVTPERRFLFADNFPQEEFFMARVSYSMNTLDASWSLVAYGMDVGMTETDINSILIHTNSGV